MANGLRQSRHELSHRAFHDSLTGLPNRALLFDRVAHALARRGSTGDRPSIGVLFIDIDDFKSVNDSLGHSHGDEVLVEVGRRIAASCGPPTRSRGSAATSSPCCSTTSTSRPRRRGWPSGSCSRSRAR